MVNDLIWDNSKTLVEMSRMDIKIFKLSALIMPFLWDRTSEYALRSMNAQMFEFNRYLDFSG